MSSNNDDIEKLNTVIVLNYQLDHDYYMGAIFFKNVKNVSVNE